MKFFERLAPGLCTLASTAVLASMLSLLDGCAKADDDYSPPPPSPTAQAQAIQSAIAAAQPPHDHVHPAPSASEDVSAEAASAPVAMGAPSAESLRMNMGASPTPTGMARLLGRPPMAGDSTSSGMLPTAIGAPHLYHLGADTFFLDQASAVGLTSEQQKKLTALKEDASAAYATTQRKIDQGEQDLWVLSSSETPDIAKIEMKVGEIARLTGQQRMAFIRAVGGAVGVLSDAQRKAVAAQEASMQPATPGPAASAMPMGPGAPSSGGMDMGGPGKMPSEMGRMDRMKPGGSMPPPAKKMGGMADAGSSNSMGPM